MRRRRFIPLEAAALAAFGAEPECAAHSVANLLEATGLTPSLLELEVTGDILLHDEARVIDMFKRFSSSGCASCSTISVRLR
ncbi:EAL domain-containing protein (putative c-di-GMP-specific phosphodiesterase class I) [Bradyrhizobium sp. USDA 4486]